MVADNQTSEALAEKSMNNDTVVDNYATVEDNNSTVAYNNDTATQEMNETAH